MKLEDTAYLMQSLWTATVLYPDPPHLIVTALSAGATGITGNDCNVLSSFGARK